MTVADPFAELLDDLEAEQDAFRALTAGAGPDSWDRLTPAPGWAIRDQVHHLARFDDVAGLAISDPRRFVELRDRILADVEADGMAQLEAARSARPAELLERWEGGRRRLMTALAPLEGGARIGWFGPPMSARSFATARLMETWAHGEDVAAAMGVSRAPTGRIRHIVHLGVVTRGWSYANRGLVAPAEPVRVELSGPDGGIWDFGPEGATDRIVGPAVDFCRVVTQRVHPAATGLVVVGPAAEEWMGLAQCFAGPPTEGPPS